MSNFDAMYGSLCKHVLERGVWDKDTEVRTVWESDGTPAYSQAGLKVSLLLDDEVPILTQKHVGWKTAIKEGLTWIWQEKSNNVNRLNEMGVKIWNQWKLPDGTVGKSYGYQLAKKKKKVKIDKTVADMIQSGYLSGAGPSDQEGFITLDQVDYLLYQLKVNPSSRRHITMLWNWDDMDEMALTPCVYETQWTVREGKLHLNVGIRSNDIALGNPFNVFQYYVIWRCIAQVTGYELGTLGFDIIIPHIYERHVEGIQHQLTLPTHEAPTLWINPDIKSFYDFKLEDFKLENYVWSEKINFEVAI